MTAALCSQGHFLVDSNLLLRRELGGVMNAVALPWRVWFHFLLFSLQLPGLVLTWYVELILKPHSDTSWRAPCTIL